MRTAVLFDKAEVMTLATGGQIELTLTTLNAQGTYDTVVLVGPRDAALIGLQRKRKRQREWAAAKRTEKRDMKVALKVRWGPRDLLTAKQAARHYGLSGAAILWGRTHGKIKEAKTERTGWADRTRYLFRFADLERWRKKAA